MALETLRDQLARGADVVHDAAERLKHGLDTTRHRQQLQRELDRLFSELGIEVYQRIERDDPVVDSVVVEDLVDRIAEVERRLELVDEAST